MSNVKSVNITEMMTSYNIEIEELPDNLKCTKCKLMLKDACQVPCGCTYCRVCINDMMENGGEFCPGLLKQCGTSPLSLFSLHYTPNKSVSTLTVKYTHNGCVHECRLADIEEHGRECQRKNVECPFRELGYKKDKFGAEEIDEHLLYENRRNCEILIWAIANINRDIELMKCELVQKDEQISTMIDQMINVENENKSITREKADLADQVRLLQMKIEREIDERHENDEIGMTRVINSQMQSNQVISTLPDAKCDWFISNDMKLKIPEWKSDYFRGAAHPYKYRLTARDYTEPSRMHTLNLILENPTFPDSLRIRLRIYRKRSDRRRIAWPFDSRVVITVADRDRPDTCKSISLQYRIERPPDKVRYRESNEFVFQYSQLRNARLNLDHGLRVSCEIFPGPG